MFWKLSRTIVLVIICAAAVGLTFLPAPASADLVQISFGITVPTSGNVSYSGTGVPGDASLLGSSITVDQVVGLNTPANAGVPLNCVGCLLNFTGGTLNGTTATTWAFNSNPLTSISLFGSVDLNGGGIGAGDIQNAQLLEGTMGASTVIALTPSQFRVAAASFVDQKHPDLLTFFGLPTNAALQGEFHLSFNATGTPPGGFSSSTVLDGGVVNTVVPIPAAVVLFATGLASLRGLLRKPTC